MRAILIAVGDELLSGIRREGNCALSARMMHDAGWKVERMEVIPDDEASVVDALNRWIGRTDVLVLSGGLGPTHDDRTRQAAAACLGCALEVDDALYDRIAARFQGTPAWESLMRSRAVQGLIPRAARGVYNPVGSAPGIYFERLGTRVWCFPGVPSEFRAMVFQELAPLIRQTREEAGDWVWTSVSVAGVAESVLVRKIPEVIEDSRLHVSVLPDFGVVELVLRGERDRVRAAAALIRGRFEKDVLPEGCATLPEVILRAGTEKKLVVACAESCTGGLLGAALSDLPGSSAVFSGSAVVYSNRAKEEILGVDPYVLQKHGAVSGECAESMARGALSLYSASIAAAVTGIAGPEGGSEEKPVGTVWFAVAVRGEGPGADAQAFSFLRKLGGDRASVREKAVRTALIALWRRMREM